MAQHSKPITSLAVKLAIAWAILLAAFTVSMTLMYLIPTSMVNAHIVSSVAYNEADERSFVDGDWSTDGSQSTFSIMLSIAQHGGADPLKDAMSGAYYRTDDLGVHGSILEGYDQQPNQSYEYYWHGWLVLLKPLLLVTDYGGIKKICWFAFFALLVLTAIQMSRRLRGGIWYALALCAAFAAAGINGIDMFPYALVMLLALCGCLFTLHVTDKEDSASTPHSLFIGFFALGALTTFLDFLTTPAITVLLPLACFILAKGQNPTSFKDLALACIGLGACWLLGYAGLWVSKWIVASIILGSNIIDMGINQVLLRSNVEGIVGHGSTHPETTSRGSEIGPIPAMLRNLYVMFPGACIYLAGLAVIAALAVFAVSPNKRESWPVLVALAVCALLPYAWYLAAANHSMIHFLFTYRLQVATVFCVLAAIVYFCQRLIEGLHARS